jgi:hypothetical protein
MRIALCATSCSGFLGRELPRSSKCWRLWQFEKKMASPVKVLATNWSRKMESFEKKPNPNGVDPSSDLRLREHIVTATIHLLQGQLLLRRMVRDQETCNPRLLLQPRIAGVRPILDECLRLGALLRSQANLATASEENDDEHIGSIAASYFAQSGSAEGRL